MHKPLHHFILFLFLFIAVLPAFRAIGRPSVTTVSVDDEYDRYKKRGDDFFKEGKYFEARRQYQNCLEVPGFENDAYAKEQIQECTVGLKLRQQADEAMQQGKGQESVRLFSQLLNLNPDDAQTKAQLADYYEREGNQLYGQQKYAEAKARYIEALKYTTKQTTLMLQIRNCEEKLKQIAIVQRPPKLIGLKVAAGVVAVGAGAYAVLLRHDYQSKMDALNQISQSADPTGSGVIANPDTYRQYDDAYKAAQAAQQKNGLFKACLGVAAVATVAEIYLLVHKPKPRTNALNWKPSSQSWGLAVSYTF
jgi:tetratricopeptide (TPR) repeat protein